MEKNENTIQQKKTIYLASLNTVSQSPSDNIYLITRSSKNKEYALSKGWKYVPDLAPSWDLFNKTRAIKERQKWNADAYAKGYKPEFIKGLKTQPAYGALQKLIEEFKDKDSLTLVCYCTDSSICHRSIIGDLLKRAFDCNLIDVVK